MRGKERVVRRNAKRENRRKWKKRVFKNEKDYEK